MDRKLEQQWFFFMSGLIRYAKKNELIVPSSGSGETYKLQDRVMIHTQSFRSFVWANDESIETHVTELGMSFDYGYDDVFIGVFVIHNAESLVQLKTTVHYYGRKGAYPSDLLLWMKCRFADELRQLDEA